jgi:hypothetical protein
VIQGGELSAAFFHVPEPNRRLETAYLIGHLVD